MSFEFLRSFLVVAVNNADLRAEFFNLEILRVFQLVESLSKVIVVKLELSNIFFEIALDGSVLSNVDIDFVILVNKELFKFFNFTFEERNLSSLLFREVSVSSVSTVKSFSGFIVIFLSVFFEDLVLQLLSFDFTVESITFSIESISLDVLFLNLVINFFLLEINNLS